MKYRTLAILAISFFSISACSCNPKKDDITPTSTSLIERTWLLEYSGVDGNRNGGLESDERDYPFNSKEYFTFNSGGVGKYKNVDETGDVLGETTFVWHLDNNNKNIVLEDLDSIYVSPVTINAEIESLDESEFIIKYQETNYNNETYPAWMAFKKNHNAQTS